MTHDATLPGAPTDELVERAAADPHRPAFHFTAPGGWLNDPNGVTQWGGVYHLFYQYNPLAPVHSRIHWGHATSRDLVTWHDEPVALIPGEEPDRDADGCWSGVLVNDGGVPTIVYSGRHGEHELPCVAVGSPDLRTWTKDPANPVIAAPPAGDDVSGFRDHCVWREESGVWRQLVGSGLRGKGGAALLYESHDLREWRYVGPLLRGDARAGLPEDVDWTGTLWECVDLFRVEGAGGTKDVLVFSAWHEGVTHHPLYWTGRYEGDAFVPDGLHRLDYGRRFFYAPQSMRDETGRRVMFGWLQEGRTDEDAVAAGWSGVMSLPRLITLGPDGQVLQAPVPEVAALRREHTAVGALRLAGDGEQLEFDGVSGDQLDLEVTLRLEPGSTARVTVRATPDGAERTVIEIHRPTQRPGEESTPGTLRLLRKHSSLDPTVDTEQLYGELPFGPDGTAEIRVIVDHSALEVFANGRALTSRVYPTRPDALGVGFSATQGMVAVERLNAWRMAGIWEDDAQRRLWP